MDILILNWKDLKNPEVGGAEIILYELARRWVKNGNKVTWFCRKFPKSKDNEVIDGIQIVRRGSKLTTYFAAFLYYRSLQKKPDKVLDVLNTVFWQTPLYVPHENRIAYVNQLAKEVLFYELPPLISHIAYLFELLQFRTYRNTKFICYADSTKQDLILEKIKPSNIQVFRLGIDRARYKPGEKSKIPHFICVNRLVAMKRTDLVVRAMKLVSKKYPYAKLMIVGYGYERDRLGKLRDKLDLGNNVFFIDEDNLYFNNTKGDKKVEAMQQSWALIFPSVKEGWGMTVTESAACATPAIVTNVTGLRDAVIDGKTGIILSKNPSVMEVGRAIIKIIENTKLRETLSNNAYTYSKSFSWRSTADTVFSLIR